tara:strand:+ start:163 stop:936 length:774 start_codon:yes stop_codon:yes gene_type:complete
MKIKLINFAKKIIEKNCKKHSIKEIPYLEKIIEESKSTGISYTDIWSLYSDIRRLKPKCILECGPGVSTYVIGCAMNKNYIETKIDTEMTCLEDQEIYYNDVKQFIYPDFKNKTNLILSEVSEKVYGCFIGMGYKNIPKKNYDYIFIDGPSNFSKKYMSKTFNFDLLEIINFSNANINGLIDERVSTLYVYSQIFKNKIKYSLFKNLTYINNVNKDDLETKNYKIFEENNSILNLKTLPFKYNFLSKNIIIKKSNNN